MAPLRFQGARIRPLCHLSLLDQEARLGVEPSYAGLQSAIRPSDSRAFESSLVWT